MRTFLRGKVTLLFMMLGMLLAFAGIAFADQIQVDGDVVAPGNNNPVSLGTVNPGQTLTPQDSRFILNCNSSEHANAGATISLNFNSGASSAGVSATNATITVPSTWPADSSNCTGVTNVNSTNSDVTITAPKAPGAQSVTAVYDIVAPTDAQNETGIVGTTTRSVTYNMTVSNLPPSISSIGGASPVTEGDQGTYTINASDPNETTLSYSLSVLSGDATVVSGANTSTPVVKFNSPGDVVLRATVNDGVNTAVTLERTITVAAANTAPTKPGTPSGTTPNQGAFTLNWGASSDDDKPDPPKAVTYRLEHKDANDASYSLVSGAGTLSTNSFSFTNASPETEGTWTYQVQASDSALTSAFSDASSAIKVDKSAPSQPNANFNKPAEDTVGGWYKDSVTVSYNGSTDPALLDTSAGSGVASYTANQPFSTSGTHNFSGKATDGAGNQSDPVTGSVKVDATNPTFDACTGGPFTQGSGTGSQQSVAIDATDAHSGMNNAGSTLSGMVNTSTIGDKTVTFTAKDNVGHEVTKQCTYKVIFNFSGFFSPIDNKDDQGDYILNSAKAGSSIPVKFSLSGNQGMDIITSAKSEKIACDSNADVDGIETLATAGSSGLNYDSSTDQYNYIWKTDKTWSGTAAGPCRQLVVTLIDGTIHRANFKFLKP
jgi:hypothetical protein